MTEHDLKNIITAYDEGSFLAASKKLYISQSALSQSIRKLEQKLGATLFVHIGSHVQPTRLCTMIVAQGRSVLNTWAGFEASIDAGIKNAMSQINIFSIGNLITSLIIPSIERFQKVYPEITVNVSELVQSKIFDHIKANPNDIGIVSETETKAGFQMIPLLKTPYYLAVPSTHPYAKTHPFTDFEHMETVNLLDFKDDWFAIPSKNSEHYEFFASIFRRVGMEPNVRYSLRTVSYLREYVMTGKVLSLISSYNARTHHDDNRISYYRLELPEAEKTIYACLALDFEPDPAVMHLLKELAASQKYLC